MSRRELQPMYISRNFLCLCLCICLCLCVCVIVIVIVIAGGLWIVCFINLWFDSLTVVLRWFIRLSRWSGFLDWCSGRSSKVFYELLANLIIIFLEQIWRRFPREVLKWIVFVEEGGCRYISTLEKGNFLERRPQRGLTSPREALNSSSRLPSINVFSISFHRHHQLPPR